jgi:endoglucanase
MAFLAAVLLVDAGRGHAESVTAYVRVNQLGYSGTSAKRAYLLAPRAVPGARFQVVDAAGRTVHEGAVGRDQGRWSRAYPHVYAIDFDAVRTPGTYRIKVTGPASGTSPRFRIGAADRVLGGALANARAYYGTQRDGAEYFRSALRTAPGHLNDTHAMTYAPPRTRADGGFAGDLSPLGVRIDASGGWSDAGDYLKFLQTATYTSALQLLAVRDFPDRLGSGAGASDLTAEARFGTDWLLRMWDDDTRTLYYQVGIGEGSDRIAGDHDLWRLPQADDTYGGTDPRYRYIRERPVFRAAAPGAPLSPNLAGRDAAALALCYQVFRKTDPPYARRCLRSAEHLFDLADTSPKGDLRTAVPHDFYPETRWHDDLELAATELNLALSEGTPPPGLPHRDPSYYLTRAAHWAHAGLSEGGESTLSVYDVSGLAHYELHRALGAARDPAGLETTRAALRAGLRKQLDGAVRQTAADPFGFGTRWGAWDTTARGIGLSVTASEYERLTGDASYGRLADRWLGNVLGANAWGTSMIIGDGSVFPRCPQHQVANLSGSRDGRGPVLAGAVVEGPNKAAAKGSLTGMRRCRPSGTHAAGAFDGRGAVFRDDVGSYPTVEPAIDLTAASPLAFAWRIRALT